MFPTEQIGLEEGKVFSQIWRSPAPSKVLAFSWKVLLNRIPTRINLLHRNVLPPNASLSYVSCGVAGESGTHMFLHCGVAWKIWDELLFWLQGAFIMPPNLFIHWACWDGMATNKKVKKGLRLVWHAALWVMWKARNDCIFKNCMIRGGELVEEIKALSCDVRFLHVIKLFTRKYNRIVFAGSCVFNKRFHNVHHVKCLGINCLFV